MDVFNSPPGEFDLEWAKSTLRYAPAFMRDMQRTKQDGTYKPNVSHPKAKATEKKS
jgi:hypothetical protein